MKYLGNKLNIKELLAKSWLFVRSKANLVGLGHGSAVKHLPSMHKTLALVLNTSGGGEEGKGRGPEGEKNSDSEWCFILTLHFLFVKKKY